MEREQKIIELLNQMTLDEKIGQLNQCGPSLVGAFGINLDEAVNMLCDGKITKEKFNQLLGSMEQDFHEDMLREGKIGGYNGISDAENILRLQKIAVEETRLGIPLLFGYDVLHGFRTITPIPLAESCAWEPELWKRTARIAADEASAAGINITFAPMADVSKDVRWGRIAEGAGEDTLINSCYSAAKVKGFQTDMLNNETAIASCVKHFAAYGASESGKDYNRVDISLQRLIEDYLPPFKACIDAGARAIMPAFNDINGVPCTSNKYLLNNLLRKELNFEGVTISDANAVAECMIHGTAESLSDSAIQCLEAGTDIDLNSGTYSEHLADAVNSEKISLTYIDEAVKRVLELKYELGLFESPYQTTIMREQTAMLTPNARQLALESAEKSVVLLKNNDILPLSPKIKVAILGELAENRGEMSGTWALKAKDDDFISLTDAFENSGICYSYFNKVSDVTDDYEAFIAVIGERKAESGEAASKTSIEFSSKDKALVYELSKKGKPVVAVVFAGRPMALGDIEPKVSAILYAWHLGVEAGNAILNILLGKVNPSAKTTVTFPYCAGQCPIYYDCNNTGRPAGKSRFTSKYLDCPSEPMYPFGYGLSYTKFIYSNIIAKQTQNAVNVTVEVCNNGEYDGEETVQCYFCDKVAQRARPVKKLADFNKIHLRKGETKKVEFILPFSVFGYYDYNMNFLVEKGAIEIMAGGNSKDLIKTEIYINPKNGGENC